MDARPRWFRMATNVFAVIGVLAVMGAAVAGLSRLIVPSPLSPEPPAGAVASVGAPIATSSLVGETRAPAPPPLAAAGAGMPDLAVRIVDTGVIDTVANEFRRADVINRGEQPAIVFDILNLGGGRSESWQFHANLPTFAGLYISEAQKPLAAGERIRFTIGFRDLMREGENRAIITLDPTNSSKDRNRSNDVATALLWRGY